jgi:hypothetical protein
VNLLAPPSLLVKAELLASLQDWVVRTIGIPSLLQVSVSYFPVGVVVEVGFGSLRLSGVYLLFRPFTPASVMSGWSLVCSGADARLCGPFLASVAQFPLIIGCLSKMTL